jgi:hypothetical protein
MPHSVATKPTSLPFFIITSGQGSPSARHCTSENQRKRITGADRDGL